MVFCGLYFQEPLVRDNCRDGNGDRLLARSTNYLCGLLPRGQKSPGPNLCGVRLDLKEIFRIEESLAGADGGSFRQRLPWSGKSGVGAGSRESINHTSFCPPGPDQGAQFAHKLRNILKVQVD